jgi:cation:H+ antiporter
LDLATIVIFVLGLVSLVLGADLVVRGASSLAILARISPLVVGLTVVAGGTSAPEVAISVQASISGNADLAVGNVVGSNIFNVLLVLGASALVAPLFVRHRLVRFDVPLMIVVSVVVLLLSLDGQLSRLESASLFAVLVIYTVALIRGSRGNRKQIEQITADVPDAPDGSRRAAIVAVVFVVFGLGLLVVGSRWLVSSATEVAEALGVSQVVIGLTVVAAGTSLPEVATSVFAALKGQRDMAVGNVVGSCILNLLLVLGVAGMVADSGLPVAQSVRAFDMPVMIAVALSCLPIFFTGYIIARWEGFVFLSYYVAYTAYVVLDATDHDALTTYEPAMAYFVLPLTVLTFFIIIVRTLHLERRTA